MNVLFFGGSFDPPHVAHVLSVAYALAVGDFERALVVPVFEHAFGKNLGAYEHRVRMCELAFAGDPRVEVSRIESELPRPNYTLRTLERLVELHPSHRFRLLVGSDVIADTEKWYGFEAVSRLAPPFVIPRAGAGQPPGTRALLPEVSSTEVRALLARAGDGPSPELEQLVPRSVLAYVAENGLYRA